MYEYFRLQYKMTNRNLRDFGCHPFIGYSLLLIGFTGFSIYLFNKSEFAGYIYILLSLYFVTKLSDIKRNDFLKTCFGKRDYKTLRILENITTAFPFLFFLIYNRQVLPAIILIVISILLALLNFNVTYNPTLPTPFYKKPFEFIIGFRNTFFLFIIAYCLTIIAIIVNNFNLGVFSLAFIFLIVLSYYLKPENEYFVWSYSLTPIRFLTEKIYTAFVFTSYICAPVFLALGICYFENIWILVFVMILGYVYLSTFIFAKYSAYPDEMNLPQAILITVSLFLPFMLIIVIPYFINQSIRKLKHLL